MNARKHRAAASPASSDARPPIEIVRERQARGSAELILKYAPSASDEERQRWVDEFNRNPAGATLRLYVHERLGVSLWAGVDQVEALAKSLFAAIPPQAIPQRASDRDLFASSLNLCLMLANLARLGQPEDALETRLTDALSLGCVALRARNEGFDEPLLRVCPRSLDSPRERPAEIKFKKWAVIIHAQLVSYLGFGASEAAEMVARYIDRHSLLPRKRNENSTCVVPKSILNWVRTKGTEGFGWDHRLEIELYAPVIRKAEALKQKGNRKSAADALLSILKEVVSQQRN
jgi:hypothetical protein